MSQLDKRSLGLLERAFCAEIEEGAGVGLGLMQTKSKLAEKLLDDGYLVRERCVTRGPFAVTVEGYRLTHLGRLTYCLTC